MGCQFDFNHSLGFLNLCLLSYSKACVATSHTLKTKPTKNPTKMSLTYKNVACKNAPACVFHSLYLLFKVKILWQMTKVTMTLTQLLEY